MEAVGLLDVQFSVYARFYDYSCLPLGSDGGFFFSRVEEKKLLSSPGLSGSADLTSRACVVTSWRL